jgi:hypothetical protein
MQGSTALNPEPAGSTGGVERGAEAAGFAVAPRDPDPEQDQRISVRFGWPLAILLSAIAAMAAVIVLRRVRFK